MLSDPVDRAVLWALRPVTGAPIELCLPRAGRLELDGWVANGRRGGRLLEPVPVVVLLPSGFKSSRFRGGCCESRK